MSEKESIVNFDDFLLTPDNVYQPEEIEEVEETEEKEEVEPEEVEAETEQEEVEEEETEEEETEEEEEKEEVENNPDNKEEQEETEEEVSVTPLIEMIHEANGWEYDEEKFKNNDSIDGLMDFVGEIIEQNSVPQFASEEVEKFNKFVKEYGADKAAEYLEVNYGSVDYETIDLSSEDNQKRVYTDYLKSTTKFSDEKIAKEVKKLADLDELEAEVEDAKKYLVEDVEKQKVAFEKHQEELKKTQAYNFNKYLGEQKNRIDSAKEIAGFELSDKDKEGLYKFAFETDRTGKTEYQKLKEKDKDLDLKLLMLAYKGVDKEKISKSATTETAKKLKKSLSRFKDKKDVKGSGTKAPKKSNPNKDIDYNDFLLK
jgi:hypothetical protein